jgi:hypothetical protein
MPEITLKLELSFQSIKLLTRQKRGQKQTEKREVLASYPRSNFTRKTITAGLQKA